MLFQSSINVYIGIKQIQLDLLDFIIIYTLSHMPETKHVYNIDGGLIFCEINRFNSLSCQKTSNIFQFKYSIETRCQLLLREIASIKRR